MHVADCVEALAHVGTHYREEDMGVSHLGIFNVSNDHPWTVVQSIECLCEELKLKPEIIYGTEGRGWVGDSPHIEPDTTRLLATGWRPRYTTRQAVIETIHDLKHRHQRGDFS